MSKRYRNWLLAITASLLLPFIFVVIQGAFARLILAFTSIFSSFLDNQYTFILSNYIPGFLGSLAAAFFVLFPFGFFMQSKWPFSGLLIGKIAVIELMLYTKIIALSVFIEYVVLILFCQLAAVLGYRFRITNRSAK